MSQSLILIMYCINKQSLLNDRSLPLFALHQEPNYDKSLGFVLDPQSISQNRKTSATLQLWYIFFLPSRTEMDRNLVYSPGCSALSVQQSQKQKTIPLLRACRCQNKNLCSGCTNPQIFETSPFAPADFETFSTIETRRF